MGSHSNYTPCSLPSILPINILQDMVEYFRHELKTELKKYCPKAVMWWKLTDTEPHVWSSTSTEGSFLLNEVVFHSMVAPPVIDATYLSDF
ncbi:hypothetical protein SCP_0903670 [Sparassis crispa]|uniref:Uncharacterized protein n=1 Tax=Sparassis crispa TaxID=139825 RepID=A0A401GW84_9APHY|nr:hypothetical protein SCP_0903670 [Sparassis crispa]GBE86488.1 hypothetical protein SCP_0903670 [Sparassis crispa]